MLVLHLVPSPAQEEALLATMHAFNNAANAIAEIAFAEHTRSIVLLQKRVYADVRRQFDLPAQLAIGAISKAARALQRDKNHLPLFEQEGAILYDRKIMSFRGLEAVSLLTLSGRIKIPFIISGGYLNAPLRAIEGQGYLFSDNQVFYLAEVLNVPAILPAHTRSMPVNIDFEAIFLAEQSASVKAENVQAGLLASTKKS